MWLKGSYKTRKNNSDFREVPPWWVPHWVKFEAKYEANNVKLNYLKWIAINRTIQPLLLNINKWNLNVLIFDLLFSVFQFHICFPNYGYGNMLYSPPKITMSSKLIFWATKSFFRTLRKNQIQKFFGPEILVCLV